MSITSNKELDELGYCIVKSKKGRGIYDNFSTMQEATKHFKKNILQYTFKKSKEEAELVLDEVIKKENSITKEEIDKTNNYTKIERNKIRHNFCNRCGKYLSTKVDYCQICKPIVKKEKTRINNILRHIKKLEKGARTKETKELYQKKYKKDKAKLDNEFYKNNSYSIPKSLNYNEKSKIPPYISNMFKNDITKELLYIEGDAKNPLITYKCRRCNETIKVRYETFKVTNNHNCIEKSILESLTVEFLKENNIDFKREYDTFTCINPETGFPLPYDFELINHKIIIETHGNQHREFTPHFHKEYSDFEKQVAHDKYKKEFALKYGYKYLELWEEDFQNNRYKKKIMEIINDKKVFLP